MVQSLDFARPSSRGVDYDRQMRAAQPRAFGGELDTDGGNPRGDARGPNNYVAQAGNAFRAFNGGTLPTEIGQQALSALRSGNAQQLASLFPGLFGMNNTPGRDMGEMNGAGRTPGAEQPSRTGGTRKKRRKRRSRRAQNRRNQRTRSARSRRTHAQRQQAQRTPQQRAQRTQQQRTQQQRTAQPRTQQQRTQQQPRADGPRSRNETGIPSGLRPNAANGAREARRLGFTGTIGGIGQRSGPSDHPHGNAIDIMTQNNRAQGRQMAEHFRQNRDQLGVKYVIFEQMIASPRTGWQWQRMPDRGSPTANHMDHVHVSFR